MIKLVSAAALALAALALAPAHADDLSRTVSYRDLDLSAPAGQQTLEKRLAVAIREVCGLRGAIDAVTTWTGRKCRRGAAARAANEAQLAITQARTRVALRGM